MKVKKFSRKFSTLKKRFLINYKKLFKKIRLLPMPLVAGIIVLMFASVSASAYYMTHPSGTDLQSDNLTPASIPTTQQNKTSGSTPPQTSPSAPQTQQKVAPSTPKTSSAPKSTASTTPTATVPNTKPPRKWDAITYKTTLTLVGSTAEYCTVTAKVTATLVNARNGTNASAKINLTVFDSVHMGYPSEFNYNFTLNETKEFVSTVNMPRPAAGSGFISKIEAASFITPGGSDYSSRVPVYCEAA